MNENEAHEERITREPGDSLEQRITREPGELPELNLRNLKLRTSQATCPDCGTEMREIKLFCKGGGSGPYDVAVRFYTAEDAKRGWFGGFPVEGRVTARMCDSCGRITLYGSAGE
jgi:hypothetical protein